MKKAIIALAFCLISSTVSGMKRDGQELDNPKQKKQKTGSVIFKEVPNGRNVYDLHSAIKSYDSRQFAGIIGVAPEVVNAKINKKPVVFELFHQVDMLRAANIHLLMVDRQMVGENNLDNSVTIKAALAEKMQKNDDKIAQLHTCLEVVTQHKNFDVQCTDKEDNSVVGYLVKRPFELEYSPLIEQALPSKSTQPILATVLKKYAPFCNQHDEEGLAPLHYSAMMAIPPADSEENDLIDHVKSERSALETIETLVHAGANINGTAVLTGNTALHLAALTDLTKTSLLIALGADHNIQDKKGQTPTDISKNPRITEILNNPAKHIADINQLVLQNVARETQQKSFFKLVNQRQMKQSVLNPVKNPCPYTQAVLQHAQNISAEDMVVEMGHELAIDDNSENSE